MVYLQNILATRTVTTAGGCHSGLTNGSPENTRVNTSKTSRSCASSARHILARSISLSLVQVSYPNPMDSTPA